MVRSPRSAPASVLIRLEEVIRLHAVRLGQRPGLLGDKDGALQRQTEHLVRVPAEGVRAFAPGEVGSSRLGERGGAAPRAVDVHPAS